MNKRQAQKAAQVPLFIVVDIRTQHSSDNCLNAATSNSTETIQLFQAITLRSPEPEGPQPQAGREVRGANADRTNNVGRPDPSGAMAETASSWLAATAGTVDGMVGGAWVE